MFGQVPLRLVPSLLRETLHRGWHTTRDIELEYRVWIVLDHRIRVKVSNRCSVTQMILRTT